MVDNVTAEAVVSAGLIFATDDIGGTHFPKTKIVIGADDAQTPLLGGTGVDGIGAIRMSLATDIPLPAGTNAIGKLAANSGVDIGDVDVLTYPGPADAKFATLGQKAKAGSMPVTLASDEDTINVAGTVTADAGTDLNTSLLALESGGNLATLAGTVSGTKQNIGIPGDISTDNSTTTPLGISGVFTGTGEDVSSYSAVSITVMTDEDAATDGFSIQFSEDNTNWDHVIPRNVLANVPESVILPPLAKFFRIVYTNGTTGQTFFRLSTLLRPNALGVQAEHLSTILVDEDLATNVRAVLAAKTPAGPFVNINATNAGNLKIGIEEANGNIQGGGTEATALRVTVATDSTGFLMVNGNVAHDGVDAGNPNKIGGHANAALRAAVDEDDRVDASFDLQGQLRITNESSDPLIAILAANSGVDIGDVDVTSIAAGSNLIGDVGLSGARTSGGTTLHKNIDVDESEDEVKGTAGQVYWIHAINSTAALIFLKFYNATAASVVVGTTVPDLTFPVPANADLDGAGFTLSIPNGIEFSTAITIAATLLVADNDATSPGGANALVVNLGFA